VGPGLKEACELRVTVRDVDACKASHRKANSERASHLYLRIQARQKNKKRARTDTVLPFASPSLLQIAARLLMTRPSVSSDLLMLVPSLSRSPVVPA
jgi:hypothetical protein